MFNCLIVNTTGVAPHWLSDGGGGGGVPPTHRNKKKFQKKKLDNTFTSRSFVLSLCYKL